MANPHQPPSFKTNVNRAPTKKWVDAKSYSYAGDDWGGYDEFDEYGTYDEPLSPQQQQQQQQQQPPPQQPQAHMRQWGQDPGAGTTNRRFYSQAPQAEASSHHQQQQQQRVSQPPRDRYSYAVGDDAHTFRASPAAQGPPSSSSPPINPLHSEQPSPVPPPRSELRQNSPRNAAATMHSQQPQASAGFDGTGGPGLDQHRRAELGSGSVHSPERHPFDQTNPFPTDANSSTVSNRAMPAPALAQAAAAATDVSRSNRFPPRQSSLSMQQRPARRPPGAAAASLPVEPSLEEQDEDAEDDGKHAAAAPVFIRPADIYRRMQEAQRDKEGPQELPGSDALAMDGLGREQEPAATSMERVTAPAPAPAPTFHIQKPSEDLQERPAEPKGLLGPDGVAASTNDDPEFLPQLDRISGVSSFGTDLWDYGSSKEPPVVSSPPAKLAEDERRLTEKPKLNTASIETSAPPENIRTAVKTAFDNEHNNSVPDTPTTSSGDMSRSNTDSTAGISPIMKGVPSGHDFHAQPTIDEEILKPVAYERTPSRNTLRGQTDGTATSPKGAEAVKAEILPSRDAATGTLHRQSPGHLPSIETQDSKAESEEGSVVQTPSSKYDSELQTPVSSSAVDEFRDKGPDSFETREADLAQAVNRTGSKNVKGSSRAAVGAQQNFLDRAEDRGLPQITVNDGFEPSIDRYSLVHDDKAEDSLAHVENEQMTRPQLPGAWVSYASTDDESTGVSNELAHYEDEDDEDDDSITATPKGMRAQSPSTAPSEIPDLTPNKDNRDNTTMANIPDKATMAALSGAGSALAASLGSGAARSHENIANIAEPSLHDNSLPVLSEPVTQPAPLDTSRGQHTKGISASSDSHPATSDLPVSAVSVSPADYSVTAHSDVISPVSMDSGADDENDKLAREIVRSLTPQDTVAKDSFNAAAGQEHSQNLDTSQRASLRASTIIPREYDSYWASDAHGNQITDADDEPVPPVPETAAVAPAVKPRLKKKKAGMLKKRFSWETEPDEEEVGDEGDEEGDEEEEEDGDVGDSDPKKLGLRTSQDATTRDVEYDDGYEATKHLPGAGLGFSPVSPHFDNPLTQSPTTPRKDTFDPTIESPKVPEKDSPASPRLSTSQQKRNSSDQLKNHKVRGSSGDARPTSVSANIKRDLRPVSQSQGPALREIMTMKNASERIERYKTGRHELASQNSGLTDWLAYMVSAHPEHARASGLPQLNTAGIGARGNNSPAAPKSAKSANPAAQQPYYLQYLDSAERAAGSGSPSTPTEGLSGKSDFFGKSRSSSSQMQAKGKDMLHNASLLSGKAASGAKGLFNKGRNKLKAAAADKE